MVRSDNNTNKFWILYHPLHCTCSTWSRCSLSWWESWSSQYWCKYAVWLTMQFCCHYHLSLL